MSDSRERECMCVRSSRRDLEREKTDKDGGGGRLKEGLIWVRFWGWMGLIWGG